MFDFDATLSLHGIAISAVGSSVECDFLQATDQGTG